MLLPIGVVVGGVTVVVVSGIRAEAVVFIAEKRKFCFKRLFKSESKRIPYAVSNKVSIYLCFNIINLLVMITDELHAIKFTRTLHY